eukprot:CAMPEP_0185394682 /NCGR_PEP_ID=MMETSP1364-20130426/81144_1 /TAXON_ID=38817 /ORGANISM="Gephyrocapsa oceanica, Strain RCC1303" /LENGTH=236 /DNA_ID=CAMNT_0027996815 /DNA_START=151 /DNA_END=860 /DNA_ORIENTATION=+
MPMARAAPRAVQRSMCHTTRTTTPRTSIEFEPEENPPSPLRHGRAPPESSTPGAVHPTAQSQPSTVGIRTGHAKAAEVQRRRRCQYTSAAHTCQARLLALLRDVVFEEGLDAPQQPRLWRGLNGGRLGAEWFRPGEVRILHHKGKQQEQQPDATTREPLGPTGAGAAASAAADAQAKADALRETVGSAVASPGLAQISSLSSMADKIDLSPSLSKFASDIGDAGKRLSGLPSLGTS